jgi:hypothetical protein
MVVNRNKKWIQYTPKIIIIYESINTLKYQCQCPKKLLIDYIKLHSKVTQI